MNVARRTFRSAFNYAQLFCSPQFPHFWDIISRRISKEFYTIKIVPVPFQSQFKHVVYCGVHSLSWKMIRTPDTLDIKVTIRWLGVLRKGTNIFTAQVVNFFSRFGSHLLFWVSGQIQDKLRDPNLWCMFSAERWKTSFNKILMKSFDFSQPVPSKAYAICYSFSSQLLEKKKI